MAVSVSTALRPQIAAAAADPAMSGPPRTDTDFVAAMALYNLRRAHDTLDRLREKTTPWGPADTASFDCMHYLGDDAIENAAAELGLAPVDRDGSREAPGRILDVGSGFGVTGRYLHRRFGADVTGVELQLGIHDIADEINRGSGVGAHARSINQDFLAVDLGQLGGGGRFDGAVSMLCILHFPRELRAPLFAKLASCLAPSTGRLYIEDMYARGGPQQRSDRRLASHLACSYLPTLDEYETQLRAAGFGDLKVDDMSDTWGQHVHDRAVSYRSRSKDEGREENLVAFYDAVDNMFADGTIGGVRISARLLG